MGGDIPVQISRSTHKGFIDSRVPAHLNKEFKTTKREEDITQNDINQTSFDNAAMQKDSFSVTHAPIKYIYRHLMAFIAKF